VVSAAAGAVGSVAGQLAKAAGARVVGIAGGPQKCALLTDELGFDAAVDHRADDWAAQLKAATPDGIDVDFENVGGALMDAIFARLNIGARVALCGLISSNAEDPPPGPRAFGNLLIQRALVKGFIVLDHFGQAPEAITEIAGLMQQGKPNRSRPSSRASSNCPPRSTCCSTARTSGSWSSRSADPVARGRVSHDNLLP
jgi:NADPH-dependent curcumin reductase CurA